jgi:hypothetical protein
MLARILPANTTVNAILSLIGYLDGNPQAAGGYMQGQNSGIGEAGPLAWAWQFPALAAGQHTVALGDQWNGTANAGQILNTATSVLVTPAPAFASTPV